MEEETRVNAYIVTQKLPKELETQQSAVSSLQKVISQPALGQDDIKALKEKIKAAQVCSMMQKTASFFCFKPLAIPKRSGQKLSPKFLFLSVLSSDATFLVQVGIKMSSKSVHGSKNNLKGGNNLYPPLCATEQTFWWLQRMR